MSKTITITAAALVLLNTAQATAQNPADFNGTYPLIAIGGLNPKQAAVSGTYVSQLTIGRTMVSATYYELAGTISMSDGKNMSFFGNMRKGLTDEWHGVISSSPDTDTQKSLPYSVTMVFYTFDFKKVHANVAVVQEYSGNPNFHQTGGNVWVFQKPK